MQRIPRKRADNYVHKDQLKFWSYEGQEDEECAKFRRRFRFRKDTVKVWAHLLDEDIGPKCESSTAFSSEQRLCLALSFYAVGSFQWSIGGGEGASQPTMCRVISRVSKVLATHADNIIRFCADDEILYQVSKGFFASAGEYFFCMKCNYINNVVHMFMMKCKWIL